MTTMRGGASGRPKFVSWGEFEKTKTRDCVATPPLPFQRERPLPSLTFAFSQSMSDFNHPIGNKKK